MSIKGNEFILEIKRNDTLSKPKIRVVTKDPQNPTKKIPVDLSGGSATFTMVEKDSPTTKKIDAATATIVSPGTLGEVEYDWEGTDTDTSGDYLGEFEITIPGGKFTRPMDNSLIIKIRDDIDGV